MTPTLIQMGYGERPGQAPRVLQLEKPLGTITAGGGKFAMVAANMVKHFGGNYTGAGVDLDEPIHTRPLPITTLLSPPALSKCAVPIPASLLTLHCKP